MNSKPEEAASASPGTNVQRPDRSRVTRGAVIAAVSALVIFLVMAHDGHMPLAVPLCSLLVVLGAWGALDALEAASGVVGQVTLVPAAKVSSQAAKLLGSMAAFVAVLLAGYHGTLPWYLTGALLTATAIATFAFGFEVLQALGPMALDETGQKRPLRERHGFWVLVAGAVLYFPALGYASLWDPWETHYGEVAREIIQRDDWISTWWSWEGFFYSKPILGQWVQALAMSALGVATAPDKVLWDAAGEHLLYPEWVVRTPIALSALIATYILYKGVAKHGGRRAGLIGGIVLATCPQWWMLAHQTMTDMPFVAAIAATFGFVLLGLAEADDSEVQSYVVPIGKFRLALSGWTLSLGLIIVAVLPQIIYLFTRNVRFMTGGGDDPFGFQPHGDEFRSGSPGNCGLPDNPTCAPGHLVSNFEPSAQALVWLATLVVIVALQRKERKTKHLYYLTAWTMAGIATMAKAFAGVCLPACAVLLALLMLRRWKEIPKMQIGTGLAAVVLLSLPWGVAMFVRHGTAFTDELIFHDMFNRALSHVHDTNDGIDTSFRYYIWQAGYALFPWSGVILFALVSWLREPRRDAPLEVVLIMWTLVTFALFSMMGTRFHHYIFPAVPPAAMLAGLAFDRILTGSKERQDRLLQAASLVMAASFVLVIAYDLIEPETGKESGPSVLMRLFTYQYKREFPPSVDYSGTIFYFSVAAVGLLLLGAVYAWRKYAVYGFIGVSMLWAMWGLDVYMPEVSNHFGQRAVFETYYKDRAARGARQGIAPPDADVVAYMLNWKGENFYTGNHIAQFRSGGKPFEEWVKTQKEHRAKSLYVATENSRVKVVSDQITAKIPSAHIVSLSRESVSQQFALIRVDF